MIALALRVDNGLVRLSNDPATISGSNDTRDLFCALAVLVEQEKASLAENALDIAN